MKGRRRGSRQIENLGFIFRLNNLLDYGSRFN
jgi:hypothetical protein